MDAKWHEALKQHEPSYSPQVLFLHLLFQKNQTFNKTGDTTTEAASQIKYNAWNT